MGWAAPNFLQAWSGILFVQEKQDQMWLMFGARETTPRCRAPPCPMLGGAGACRIRRSARVRLNTLSVATELVVAASAVDVDGSYY